MTVRATARRERATRLFGWTLMAAVCGFLLWIVFGGAAHADPGSGSGAGDPKGRGARHRQCGQCVGAHDRAGFVQRGRGAGLCGHEPAGAQYRREPA